MLSLMIITDAMTEKPNGNLQSRKKINLFQDYISLLSMIDINNPDFKNTSKIHDWRNYVPYDWQKNWELFTERERQIICVMAQSQADKEEWD